MGTYPVALKGLDAAPTLKGLLLTHGSRGGQLPHLNSLVQAAADEFTGVGGERHTVNAILVAIGPLKALEKESQLDVPHPDALVKRAGSHILSIGRDGNSSDTVLDGERERIHAGFDIPESDGPVATAGGNRAPVTSKVKRVDILLVACKGVADLSRLDIPNLHKSVAALQKQWRADLL